MVSPTKYFLGKEITEDKALAEIQVQLYWNSLECFGYNQNKELRYKIKIKHVQYS